VERAAWTDQRLDDLSHRVDAGFVRVDADLRELRSEVGRLRSELRSEFREAIGGLRSEMRREIGGLRRELRGEVGGLRSELRGEVGSLRGDIDALRITLLRVGGGVIVGLVGVIAAVLAGG
jgi:hypothetical protein